MKAQWPKEFYDFAEKLVERFEDSFIDPSVFTHAAMYPDDWDASYRQRFGYFVKTLGFYVTERGQMSDGRPCVALHWNQTIGKKMLRANGHWSDIHARLLEDRYGFDYMFNMFVLFVERSYPVMLEGGMVEVPSKFNEWLEYYSFSNYMRSNVISLRDSEANPEQKLICLPHRESPYEDDLRTASQVEADEIEAALMALEAEAVSQDT